MVYNFSYYLYIFWWRKLNGVLGLEEPLDNGGLKYTYRIVIWQRTSHDHASQYTFQIRIRMLFKYISKTTIVFFGGTQTIVLKIRRSSTVHVFHQFGQENPINLPIIEICKNGKVFPALRLKLLANYHWVNLS